MQNFDSILLVLDEGLFEALFLVLFGVEVLDCFEVEQAVSGLLVVVVVRVLLFLLYAESFLGHDVGDQEVEAELHNLDHNKMPEEQAQGNQ